MRALYFGNNQLQMIDTDPPKAGKNEVLIRPLLSGVCNTDLEILKGYMNFQGILGHEFVGVVEKAPEPDLQGKTVVGEINLACGRCDFCLRGLSTHCPNRTVLGIQEKDGVMADYLTLPMENIHVVPQNVGISEALFTEPLAAACEILEQLEILQDYRVLLIGDGKLAQLIARVLHTHTENLLVVGKHPAKMDLLQKHDIPVIGIERFSEKPASFQVVIEATGNWSGWELALKMVRPRGYLVLKSTYTGSYSFNPASLVINEITLIGSRCGPFSVALQMLSRGLIDPTDLVTHTFSLNQWEKAFNAARHPDSIKVVLEH